jgi:hypothetical protein
MEQATGLQLYSPETQLLSLERIIIYGRVGIGKTRFALMLPDTEKWGEILYYAADDNSELLGSIPASARKRVHVVKPRGTNHRHNFQQFCMQDWRRILDPKTKKPLEEQPYARVRTLVVDTFSTVTYRVIQQIANEGSITREEHFWVGDKETGGFALPSRSDYQGIESASKSYVDMLFDKQRDYNIIFICHEDSKEVAKGVFAGGPAVPGRRMLEDLPASFTTVIRLIREPILIPGKQVPGTRVIAVSDNDGKYVAKMREGDVEGGNKLGHVPLDKNPVTYWEMFDVAMAGTPQGGNNNVR